MINQFNIIQTSVEKLFRKQEKEGENSVVEYFKNLVLFDREGKKRIKLV